MLTIECVLGDGERVSIEWHGAIPTHEELIAFLRDQYPNATIMTSEE